MGNMVRLMSIWAVSSALLGNLFFVLVLGGLGALFLRTATIRENRPLKPVVIATATLIALALGVYLTNSASRTLGAYAATTAGIVSPDTSNAGPDVTGALSLLLIALFVLHVPLVMAIVFAVRSRRRGVTVASGLVRGFATTALPTVVILALLYVPTIVVTGRLEARMLDLMQRAAQHEGRTCAQLTGHEWPPFGPEGAK